MDEEVRQQGQEEEAPQVSSGLYHPLKFICPACDSAITVEARCGQCGAGLCSQTSFTHTRKRNVPLFLVGTHACSCGQTPEDREKFDLDRKWSSSVHRASTRAE